MRSFVRRAVAPLAILLAFGFADLSAQQTGSIVGQVTAEATGQPLAGAQVQIVGTTRGTVTNAEGRYLLVNVPTGERQVRIVMLGYGQATQTVQVSEGESVTANFSLAQSAIQLDEVVVNVVTGEAQRKRELGSSVATLNVEEMDFGPAPKFSELLTAQAPSINVLQSSGTTGTGTRIRIRGSNSVSLSNDPLVIIDGVRMDSGTDIDLFTGGQSPSRINDIPAEEIASIEVLRGPSASALYGTAASNGVILITTKRGQPGTSRWHFYSEVGQNLEVTDYPANFRGVGTDADTGEETTCHIFSQANGGCTFTELRSFNPLQDSRTSPFRDGLIQKYGMSLSGGNEAATYFVSAELHDEEGVYDINALERLNFRANVSARPRDDLELTASSSYISSDAQLPNNDNNLFSYLLNGQLGGAEFDPDDPDGIWFFFPPETIDHDNLTQDVERFMGSMNATWRPADWLSINGTGGIDLVQRLDRELVLPNNIIFGETFTDGFVDSNRFQVFNYTANAAASAVFDVGSDVLSTTTVGADFHKQRLASTEGFGAGLSPGTSSLGATSKLFFVDEDHSEIVTVAGFVRQQLAWRDRVFLTGTLRGDDNSAFGTDFGFVYYPGVNLSWVIDEEEFFPRIDALSSLRLRGAWGRTGQRPGFRQAVTFFSPVAVAVDGEERSGLTVGGTGNVELEPEKTDEFELGFDAGFLDDRFRLDFTYFNRTTDDLLVSVPLPPSLGASGSRFENIGKSENEGVELSLDADLLRRNDVRWNVRLGFSTSDPQLVRLGEGIEPIIFGLGGDTQRHAEGYPLGGYWQPPITGFSDDNGDGIISPSEVTVGDTATFQGKAFPDREISLSTSLNLWRYVRVNALFEHRGGHKLFNDTDFFRCGQSTGFFRCQSAYDPDTPLERQAAIASRFTAGTRVGFIEDGDYTRFRELSVTLTAPDEWARQVRGANALSLTVGGRNLAVWTDYTGLDPELLHSTGGNFTTAEFFTQPPVRVWTARLDVTF